MSLISGMIKQKIDYIYSVELDEYRDETRTVVYTNVPCRFRKHTRRTIIVGAEKLVYNSKAYILPTYTLKEDYLIEKDGIVYTIVAIENKYNMEGHLDFYEVLLK